MSTIHPESISAETTQNNSPASSAVQPSILSSLPPEILQNIFYFTTSTTFFQLVQVNSQFFSIAAQCRELILHHLRHVPGIKLGLDDRSISTADLFLIFRQRAASHLYGVNYTADCRSLEPSPNNGGIFDPRASCLTVEPDGLGGNTCVVFKNSLRIRLNCHNNGVYAENIESPYGDGRAKILQVVQKSYYITVLYAWTPPETDPADNTSHPSPTIPYAKQPDAYKAKYDSRDGHRYSSKRSKSKQPSSSQARVHYHLLHYDMFRSDRPVFFSIPTHKSLRNKSLVPIHLAVHNRLQCAILWDHPDTVAPTPHATVCLYTAEHLPRYEQGNYDVWVIYPFDHPAAHHRSGVIVGGGENGQLGLNYSDDPLDSSGGMTFTYTKDHQPSSNGGRDRDYDSDLRLLHFPLKPRSIAFFKEGRRLSLYAPGSTTPFTTLFANESIRTRLHPSTALPSYPGSSGISWPRNLCRRVRRTNHTSIYGHHFTLALPFYSKHETITPILPDNHDPDDPVPEVECMTHMLCLGTARIPSFTIPAAGGDITGSGPEVLTIVQIRKRVPYDLCMHSELLKDDLPTLPRPPREPRRRRTHTNPNGGQDLDLNAPTVPDLPDDDDFEDDNTSEPDIEILSDEDVEDTDQEALEGTNLRVVARLWGWNAQSTTLAGLETVSVSPRGERIAVAQWDKVLIYALNPSAMCEEAFDDSDDESNHEGSNLNNDSDSDSEAGSDDGDGSVATVPSLVAENGNGGANIDGHDNAPQPASASEPFLSLQLVAGAQVPGPSSPPNPPPPASVSSNSSTSIAHLLNYYPQIKDKHLGGSVVQLRPIVLKMDGGAIVRKMNWGLGRPARANEDGDESSDEEDEVELPKNQDQERATVESKDEKVQDDEKGNLAAAVEDQGPKQSPSQSPDVANEHLKADVIDMPVDIAQLPSKSQPLPAPAIAPLDTTPRLTPSLTADVDDIPPAPFSDMKLTGQIRHIDRPIGWYREAYKFAFDIVPTPSLALSQAQSVSELVFRRDIEEESDAELGKGKEKEKEKETDEVQMDVGGNPEGEEGEEGKSEDTAQGLEIPAQKDDESSIPKQAETQARTVPDISKSTEPELAIGGVSQLANASDPTPENLADTEAGPWILETPTPPRKKRKPRRRIAENELIVMTDRGLQIWDLSVWGTRKRVREELVCDDILH